MLYELIQGVKTLHQCEDEAAFHQLVAAHAADHEPEWRDNMKQLVGLKKSPRGVPRQEADGWIHRTRMKYIQRDGNPEFVAINPCEIDAFIASVKNRVDMPKFTAPSVRKLINGNYRSGGKLSETYTRYEWRCMAFG